MTAAVASTLAVLALLDATFAGFRASLGRTGRIDHRRGDRRGAARGAVVVAALLGPVIAVVAGDAAARPDAVGHYADAGAAMLIVYGPYAGLVLLALGAYFVLDWRTRYLAAALVLGPFTFLRPLVAVLGGVAAAIAADDVAVTVLSGASVLAVLAVEPVANRVWYSSAAG